MREIRIHLSNFFAPSTNFFAPSTTFFGFWMVGFVLSILFMDRLFANEVDKEKEAEASHYILRLDDPNRQFKNLPSMYPVIVTVVFKDGAKKEYLAAKGWDFNSDGRFDMMQMQSKTGEDIAYVFDFDGDGKVDFVKTKLPPTFNPDGTKTESSKWTERLANEHQRLFKKPILEEQEMRIGKDGTVELYKPGELEKVEAEEKNRYWGLDLGLDMSSTKIHAEDKNTHGKADLYSYYNAMPFANLGYYFGKTWSLKSHLGVRLMQFEKKASDTTTFNDEDQKILPQVFIGAGFNLPWHLHASLLAGVDHQLFLNSTDGVNVKFETIMIPKIKADLVWGFYDSERYDAGLMIAVDYGFGGSNSKVKAKPDLGYQFSPYLQRNFSASYLGIQMDYRYQAQLTKDLHQDQIDFALLCTYGMPIGGGTP